jgi:hypothetical protein
MKDEDHIHLNVSAVRERYSIDTNVDNALHFLRLNDQINYTLSRDVERKLVRKVDWILMPLMAAIYNL